MNRTTELVLDRRQTFSTDALATRQLQELWFVLMRKKWGSIVLVPTSRGSSTAELAKSLAEVGRTVSGSPVSAVAVRTLRAGSARALADLARFVRRATEGERSWAQADVEVLGSDDTEEQGATLPPVGQLIIAVPSILEEPLGIAAAQAADSVVIAIERDKTRVADARRAIDLVGRERVAGAFLVG